MNKVRFLMIGGFLGAGKTTTIARLARHYMDQGKRVGLVTNDQAYDLVDTHSLRAQGFDVGEVPGACFCCKFDDLVSTAASLSEAEVPDIIIAEPVGSCTDLAATVIEPLKHLHGGQYETGPLAVLLKPGHGQKILREETGAGFSPKAAYIFLKQIEEADVVVINKVDRLSTEETDELVQLVNQRFPGKQVLAISGREGANFPAFVEAMSQNPARGAAMDVDYDIYAEGEAELGWLNCQARLTAENSVIDVDQLVVNLVQRLRDLLESNDAEPAHLKVLAQTLGETAIANLTGSTDDVELSLASEVKVPAIDLIVNARVAGAPEMLEDLVRQAISELAGRLQLQHEITGMQRFRPGRPVPTHRMAGGE